MSTFPRAKPITAEEFEQFDPEWRYDLIRGELVPMPPMPGDEHGAVTFDFGRKVGNFVEDHELGLCYAAETRFLIERNPDTAIAPDWAFISTERLPEKRVQGFVPIVPDAVLEVRSPSDRTTEVEAKIAQWLNAGVRLVWELNLKKRVLTVYRPGTEPRIVSLDDIVSGEDVLPGFARSLRSLFPRGSV
jgi:Uma2 family endonuclease